MNELLKEPRFDFLSGEAKAFILAFNTELARLGYDFGGKIGSGYCWGKYMIIYTKTGVKSKNVVFTFEFHNPRVGEISDFVALFAEFFTGKRKTSKVLQNL